ncbi:glycosyltransferase [Bacillus cereus group sp. N21]|uniref:MGDG synthase family glycosyltransferase n=1 Tax=Bacillus cereus group sp. N21 TaxID=2794591 RepID=UPI0018F59319|nr:glycosyltransferase [Bacillus cereus group sp. N21]MBJ8031363.1 UDP-glucuronosyltransferase [Bacillus cereus group sp. N21]
MEQHSTQKTILFLPFLQIPSGHHQVAHALMEGIQKDQFNIKCDQVDILSYSYGRIEALVSNVYLKWIKEFPDFYNWIYQNSVYKNVEENKRYRLYELLFVPFMRRLIRDKQPDLIICTHALPSYILNYLKEKGELKTPVINVYTDYFIHSCWGIEHNDFHFVPSHHMKEFLKKKGVNDEQIFITGIPIHNKIKKQKEYIMNIASSAWSVLITGGSLGVGAIEDLIHKIGMETKIHFYVLCGKNANLYQKLQQLQRDNITPLKYITSREKMNKLYDQIDAIVTKPGGVTISESLFKRKPIFIYHVLPGQEEINLQQLKKLGVIFYLNKWKDEKGTLEEQLYSFFQNKNQLQRYQERITEYHRQLINKEPSQIIKELIRKE